METHRSPDCIFLYKGMNANFQKVKSLIHAPVENERMPKVYSTLNERTSWMAELVQGASEEVSIYRHWKREY